MFAIAPSRMPEPGGGMEWSLSSEPRETDTGVRQTGLDVVV